MAGRRSPLNLFMVTTSPVQCGRGCLSRRRLSSDHKAVLWQAIPFTCFPTSPQARFDSSVFRVLLLRRLWQPLPPSSRFCRCGLLLDPLGHHRQLAEEQECWVAEPSHWKALQHVFALRQVSVSPQTSWRGTLTWCLKSVWMVVVWKLPLFRWSPTCRGHDNGRANLKRDGTPQLGQRRCRWGCSGARPMTQGTSFRIDWSPRESPTCGSGLRGRWSSETQCFLRQAAKAKTRHEPPPLRTSARMAWLLRWSTILACSGVRALALSLMEVRAAVGHDGPTPSTAEVVGEARYAGFV